MDPDLEIRTERVSRGSVHFEVLRAGEVLHAIDARPTASDKLVDFATQAGISIEDLLEATRGGSRDEFPPEVKDVLFRRVAGLCSSPTCNQHTSGPHPKPHRAINIGEAAHITAAAKNGPRFDDSLTRSERSSASNGLWLCRTCAALIDRDEVTFTEEVLRAWKAEAEARARVALEGSPPPSDLIASIRLAAAEIEIGDLDAATTLIRQIRVHSWDRLAHGAQAEVQVIEGRLQHQRGDTDSASATFLAAAALDPQNLLAAEWAATGAFMVEEFDRARGYAAKAIRIDPASARAWSVSVRTDSRSWTEVLSEIPEDVRDSSLVRVALSDLAALQGDHQAAHEHARLALESGERQGQALLCLARRELEKANLALRRGSPRAERESLLQPAAASAERAAHEFKRLQHLPGQSAAFLTSAQARLMSGDNQAALAAIGSARLTGVNVLEADLLRVRALLMDGQAKESAAVAAAALAVLPKGERPFDTLSLIDAQRIGDSTFTDEQALDQLYELLGAVEASSPALPSIVRLAVKLHLACGQIAGAQALLDDPRVGGLPIFSQAVQLAAIHHAAGDIELAEQQVCRALESYDEPNPIDTLRLASTAAELGMSKEAARLYRDFLVVSGEADGETLARFVDNSRLAGRLDLVSEVCGQLDPALRRTPPVVTAELHALAEIHAQGCAERIGALLNEVPGDKVIRVICAQHALEIGHPELVRVRPEDVPYTQGEVTSPRLGALSAWVLSQYGFVPAAADLVYETYRRYHTTQSDLASALSATNYLLADEAGLLPTPDRVEPGLAVHYTCESELPDRWVVLWPGEIIEEIGEIPVDGELAQRLLGCRVGEAFQIEPGVMGEIQQLCHPAQRAITLAMSEFSELFPDSPALRAMHLDPSDPVGSFRRGVTEVMEPLRERHQSILQLIENYNTSPLPLTFLAHAWGAPPVRFVWALGESEQHIIHCSVDDEATKSAPLDTATTLVLDATSIATAWACGILAPGRRLGPWRVVVAPRLIAELEEAAAPAGNHDRLLVTASGNIQLITADQAEADREEVRALLTALRPAVHIEEPPPPVEVVELQRFRSHLGAGECDAIALALQRGSVLWSDDLAVAGLCCDFPGFERTCTEAMIGQLRRVGALDEDAAVRAKYELLVRGYWAIVFNRNDVARFCEMAEWNPKSSLFLNLGRYLHLGRPPLQSAFKNCAIIVAGMFNGEGPRENVRLAIHRVLRQACEHRADGVQLLAALRTHAELVFPFEPRKVDRLRATIRGLEFAMGRSESLWLPPGHDHQSSEE